jgi:hypothetical protein
MPAKPLIRIDVSARSVRDPGVLWLIHNGFTFRVTGRRVFLERRDLRTRPFNTESVL